MDFDDPSDHHDHNADGVSGNYEILYIVYIAVIETCF
jgi:hypothetical protein